MDNESSVKTLIFSDYFQSYQPKAFKEKGYILKELIIHSVCFGDGNVQIITIEGLWS